MRAVERLNELEVWSKRPARCRRPCKTCPGGKAQGQAAPRPTRIELVCRQECVARGPHQQNRLQAVETAVQASDGGKDERFKVLLGRPEARDMDAHHRPRVQWDRRSAETGIARLQVLAQKPVRRRDDRIARQALTDDANKGHHD